MFVFRMIQLTLRSILIMVSFATLIQSALSSVIPEDKVKAIVVIYTNKKLKLDVSVNSFKECRMVEPMELEQINPSEFICKVDLNMLPCRLVVSYKVGIGKDQYLFSSPKTGLSEY